MEKLTQYTGHKVYALTVTNKSTQNQTKPRAIFAVPHAHEPAGTAACMSVIDHLLTGEDPEGFPTDINRKDALNKLILTFIPDRRGLTVPLDQLLDMYYEQRKWDKKTGIPTSEKLQELGLTKEMEDLAKTS